MGLKITVGGFESEILQENHYYPFGLNMERNWWSVQPVRNGYQYNGKELNEEFGLGWNDYGARWYDGAIGRWGSVDPLAEEMNSWSPYNYTFNNPVRFIDPDGRAPDWIPSVNDNGDIVLTAEAGDNLTSLKKFFGSTENALEYVPDDVWSRGKTIEGDEVTLKDSNYSDAFKDAVANPENYYEGSGLLGIFKRPINYNCYSACMKGSAGLDFSSDPQVASQGRFMDVVVNGIIDGGDAQFEKVDVSKAKFGKTIIPYSGDHAAVFFGRSSDGTVFTFNKPGPSRLPKISKANDVMVGSGSPSGFYNEKQ